MSDEFRRELAELRAEIAEPHRSLEIEVRTRRVVVVDEAGNERITAKILVLADVAEISTSETASAELRSRNIGESQEIGPTRDRHVVSRFVDSAPRRRDDPLRAAPRGAALAVDARPRVGPDPFLATSE